MDIIVYLHLKLGRNIFPAFFVYILVISYYLRMNQSDERRNKNIVTFKEKGVKKMGKESTRVCIYKLKGKKETKLLPCMVVSNRPSQEALLKAVEKCKKDQYSLGKSH